jgi:hypothetical protein
MAAVAATELFVALPLSDATDEVSAEDTSQRVTNPSRSDFLPEEGMAATAGILPKAAPLAHQVNPMSEQPASMANLLMKGVFERVDRPRAVNQQRMTTALADVFRMTISRFHSRVVVAKDEAREDVANMRFRPVFVENFCTATTLPSCYPPGGWEMTVGPVAEDQTDDPGNLKLDCPGQRRWCLIAGKDSGHGLTLLGLGPKNAASNEALNILRMRGVS